MTAETALIAANQQARRGQAHPPAAIVSRSQGEILPPGASWIEAEQAYNFSLYAKHAESVVLLLFAEDDFESPLLEFRLDPRVNKTWVMWHCQLGGDVGAARYYAYRIDGPRAAGPGMWHAYDPEKILLDPCAKEVFFPPGFDREAARRPGSNLGKAPWVSCRAEVRTPARLATGRRDLGRIPRSSTRCTSAASRGIPTAASRPSAEARSPV